MPNARDVFTASEVKAGALVLTAVAVLVVFVAAIRGCAVADDESVLYHAQFRDVGGLGSGASVRFGGFEAGRVVEVELDPEDPHRIRVTARVRRDVPVNQASVASINQVSLTSEKHLEISVGDASADRLEAGATIPSTGAAGGLFDVPDVTGVITRIEALLDDIIHFVGVDRTDAAGGDQVDLTELVRGLDRLLGEVTDAARDIRAWIERDPGGARELVDKLLLLEDRAIALFEELHGAVADNREPIARTADNLARITDRAGTVLDELATALESSLHEVERAGAGASELLADQRPAIEAIIDNLRRATRDLGELSRRLANDPSLLIRGGAPDGRGRGEDR